MLSSRPLLHGARPCAFLLVLGCSGTDVGYPRVSEEPACPEPITPTPTPSGGASAAGATGAPRGTEGGSSSANGGASGMTNGAGMVATAGTATTAPFEWPGPFEPSTTAADGHHNPGTGCMSASCHGSKVPFSFGGTIYQADGKTGAPNVQVGITDGILTLTAYSASNGNIWLPSSAGQLDFANARIAIRSAKGERTKPATAGRGAACNGGGCHGSAMRLLEP